MIPEPEFFDNALCTQIGYDMFFPDRGKSSYEAKATCARCDVREQCLEWALSQPGSYDQDGIYGGLAPHERREVRRQRREAA